MSLSLLSCLCLAATSVESEALGVNSGEGWAWGEFMDGFIGPAILIAGMTFIVLLSLRAKKRNQDLARLGSAPRTISATERNREALERMAVDLEEVARSVSAMLDTRMRTLERLIEDADRRIARLKKEGGASPEGTGAEPNGRFQSADPAGNEKSARVKETLAHHANIYGLADQGLSVNEIAEQTGYQRGEVELVLSLREATRSEEDRP